MSIARTEDSKHNVGSQCTKSSYEEIPGGKVTEQSGWAVLFCQVIHEWLPELLKPRECDAPCGGTNKEKQHDAVRNPMAKRVPHNCG